jgi:hypothetical protein
MARKQDKQSRTATPTKDSGSNEKAEEHLNLKAALSSETLSAAQVRNLQSKMGNRALNTMLSTRSNLLDEDVAEEEQKSEKEEKEHSKTTPQSATLSSSGDNGGGETGNGSAFWSALFGGDDENDDEPQTSVASPTPRHKRPWRPARVDGQSPVTSEEHHIGPRRPSPQATGHRFFYALDCWITDPAEWSNPDTDPSTLIDLPTWHPLSRCHRAAQFWKHNALSEQTQAVAAWSQTDPTAVGHCVRVTRSVGLLALAQGFESEVQNPQRVADATAVALQESARVAIESIDREAILSTNDLFKRAVLAEAGAIPPLAQHKSTPNKDCPLLLKALRFALPKKILPALIWIPDLRNDEAQSGVIAMVDTLLNRSPAPQEIRLRDLGSPINSAIKLRNACGKMRLDFAASALALWRTCGQDHYHATRALLAASDRKLRKNALDTTQIIEKIEALSGTSKDSAYADLNLYRKRLEDNRQALENLELDVHRSLVSLCTQIGSASPWNPTHGTATKMQQAWQVHESAILKDPETYSALVALCVASNNPWLGSRAQSDWGRRQSTLPAGTAALPEAWLKDEVLKELQDCTMIETTAQRQSPKQ